ncbi:ABC transporter substrate-binding protein [Paenibacillaceae bacterium WGS1546]|uniref:ABC transporter substrate-binding protein n=1 Tax=Cohnella sp. WGS1546 TaxID=3366810 RepID=UPI00372D0E21
MAIRKMTALLTSAALLVVLAACASGSNGETGQSGQPSSPAAGGSGGNPEQIELRVAWWGGEGRHALWNEAIDKFQEKYPHITVKREYTDISAFFDKLNTQMAGGAAPDVMTMARKFSNDYIQRGQLMELDDMIADSRLDLSNFNPQIVSSGVLNGKNYMISLGSIVSGTFYNTGIFERAGVAPPVFDWTWDEFVDKAIELQAALPEGVWATGDYSMDEYEFRAFFLGRDKDMYTEDGQLGFDKQDLTEWLQIWERLREAGAVPPPEVQAEYPSEIPENGMFGLGKVAMLMRPQNQFNANQKVMQDNVDIVRIPTGQDRNLGQDLDGTHISIYAKTKYPDEAALLVNFLINDPDAVNVLKLEYGPLGSQKMNDELKPQLTEPEVEALEFYEKVSDIAKTPNLPPAGNAEIVKELKLAGESVAFKQKTIEKAVDDFFAEAEKTLK